MYWTFRMFKMMISSFISTGTGGTGAIVENDENAQSYVTDASAATGVDTTAIGANNDDGKADERSDGADVADNVIDIINEENRVGFKNATAFHRAN